MNATVVPIKSGKPRRRPLGTSRTDSGCQKVFWRRACAAPGVRQLARLNQSTLNARIASSKPAGRAFVGDRMVLG
jgi:hypothetical protein